MFWDLGNCRCFFGDSGWSGISFKIQHGGVFSKRYGLPGWTLCNLWWFQVILVDFDNICWVQCILLLQFMHLFVIPGDFHCQGRKSLPACMFYKGFSHTVLTNFPGLPWIPVISNHFQWISWDFLWSPDILVICVRSLWFQVPFTSKKDNTLLFFKRYGVSREDFVQF